MMTTDINYNNNTITQMMTNNNCTYRAKLKIDGATPTGIYDRTVTKSNRKTCRTTNTTNMTRDKTHTHTHSNPNTRCTYNKHTDTTTTTCSNTTC